MKKIIYYVVFVTVLLGVYLFITGFFTNKFNNLVGDAEGQADTRQREGDVENEMIVYETDAESADECSSYETFDSENMVCSFECNDENECKLIQNEIDNELSTWADDLAEDKGPVEEKNIASDDKSLKAEYTVSTGEKITLKEGKDDDKYQKIWEEISELSPDTLSNKFIETYQIFDNKDDDTLAFVDDEDQNGKWRVAVNLAGYNTSTAKENKATFIHELGHIITLNSDQVNPNITKTSCKTFYLDEGCTNTNSYLNNFKKLFWVGTTGEQTFNQNKFVTEYAATNEVEDLAESFAFFVLSKDRESLGHDDKGEKVRSFFEYPELVAIRNSMRSVLSQDIVRARKLSQ